MSDEEIKEEKSISSISNPTYHSPYQSALMTSFSTSLNPYYRENAIPDTENNETPPMSASSSSSPNPSPNLKKKVLSDVISKLHKVASNQTTPCKSSDESTENDDSDSQINECDANRQAPKQVQNKSQQKLFDLLTKANLTQYFGSFIEQGGDDVDQLCDANDSEFKEICDLVGMSTKPLHVKRLKKIIDQIKKSKQTSDLVKAELNYGVHKFLPESSLSLNLPTPHSSCSSASSTGSNPSFSISKLFNRSNDSPVQGLLTTGNLLPMYPMAANALNLSRNNETKKEELESEDDDNFEDYADTDDVEDEDEDEEVEETRPQTMSSSSSLSIKIEQNEKMIKKNKVIELYTKGERCVRKLSQLTGVPLTTVYRVIGKLKGINYNIPRGNGAGRKTILDAQDREILVEILNKQPRISRKALGKELEKLTGKSIHNSTLNRELCRLRYQNTNGQIQQDSIVKSMKKPKKFDELNEECLRMINGEAKRFGCQMSQSEFECKPLSSSLNANLSKRIIEICQMSTNLSQNSSQQLQQLKLEKIKHTLDELMCLGDSFYDRCLYETSVQLCLQKPTLLTRHDDLLCYSKRILENLQIIDDLKSKIKRTATNNLEQQTQKKSKIQEETPLSVQNPFSFYTAALALHIQQGQSFDFNSYLAKLRMNLYQSQQDSLRMLIEKNDSEMKLNLKKQEELRVKLFGLSISSANNEQMKPVYENLQSQLGDLIKQHAHLLSEQARLKSHELSSQSDIRTLSENDDANSLSNELNENIDILK